MDTHALLVAHLGPLDAAEVHAAGFVTQLADDADGLDAALAATVTALASHAPLTMWATKQAVTRLRRATLPDGDDLVERVYGSADFAAGVAAFGTRQPPTWGGR
jgi:enoyl-CoA hydratase/carnithine racemase